MRRRGLKSAKLQITNYKTQIPQRGYMLITLILALALITIALLTVLPDIAQQIKRDREEEMIHRGTAYMRAIQHFYKKFGRYPMKVEELENTNNLRFIRKRYKDPLNRDPATGKEKDFKFLHQTDINLNNGPVLGPGQNGMGGQGGFGGTQGGFGGAQGGLGGAQGGLGGMQGGLQQTGSAAGQTSSGGTSGSSSDTEDSNPSGSSSSGLNAGSNSSNSNSGSSSGFNGPTFGGGPILGVASTSKAKSIRVFYEKSKYSDWYFIYVPQGDRGGLLKGPVNPGMPAGNLGGITPGQAMGGALSGQGQGLGLAPNAGQSQGLQTQTQPAQNSGQTPPEQ
jgi:type II secretory pathway pseudopilin PulG